MTVWPGDYWHEIEAGHHRRECVTEKGCPPSWQPRRLEKRGTVQGQNASLEGIHLVTRDLQEGLASLVF